jgi:flavin-dependent dehydrogenase
MAVLPIPDLHPAGAATMPEPELFDVAIIGGGLAGLSLAIQIKRQRPQTTVAIFEKQCHPLPEAAHKVGESSVEVGARYFSQVLGLSDHLREGELPKLGLRFFFSAEGNTDIAKRLEFGTDTFFPAGSFQLDRGRFENFLGQEALRLGADFQHSTSIRSVDLGTAGAQHGVSSLAKDGSERSLRCRWLVDASGRSALIKRRLGLHKKVGHQANSVWFRFSERIAIDDWSEDPHWRDRISDRRRWLSTNHLMGPGYWVWLIPLGSGSTSVGIVVDARLHPLETMSTYDKAFAWLERHEPQCAERLRGRKETLQDFRMLKDYSYSCETAFSADRWSMVGEACAFLDPFYSPGSDYIAMGNTLTCDLIVKDLDGIAVADLPAIYNNLYFHLFTSNLTLFENQYPIYGNAQVMSYKIIWDWAYYWSVTASLFFHDRLTDVAMLLRIRRTLKRAGRLNAQVQALLRAWHEAGNAAVGSGFVNVATIPFMVALNRSLTDRMDDLEFERHFGACMALLKRVAGEIAGQAGRQHTSLDLGELTSLASERLDLLAPVQAMLAPSANSAASKAGAATRADAVQRPPPESLGVTTPGSR